MSVNIMDVTSDTEEDSLDDCCVAVALLYLLRWRVPCEEGVYIALRVHNAPQVCLECRVDELETFTLYHRLVSATLPGMLHYCDSQESEKMKMLVSVLMAIKTMVETMMIGDSEGSTSLSGEECSENDDHEPCTASKNMTEVVECSDSFPVPFQIDIEIFDVTGTLRFANDSLTLAQQSPDDNFWVLPLRQAISRIKQVRESRSLSHELEYEMRIPHEYCTECARQKYPLDWFSRSPQELPVIQSPPFACLACPNMYFCSDHTAFHQRTDTAADAVCPHCPIPMSSFQPVSMDDHPSLSQAIEECFQKFGASPFLGTASRTGVHSMFSFRDIRIMADRISRRMIEHPNVSAFLHTRSLYDKDVFVALYMSDSPIFFAAEIACALLRLPTVTVIDTVGSSLEDEAHRGKLLCRLRAGKADPLNSLLDIDVESIGLESNATSEYVVMGTESTSDDDNNTLLALFPTSGTSQIKLKYVQYKRSTWLKRLCNSQPTAGSRSLQIVCQFAPMTHFSSRSACWSALFAGGCRVFVNPSDIFYVASFLHPTGFFLVPALWYELFLTSQRNQISPINVVGTRCLVVSTGSAPIEDRVWRWMQQTFSAYCRVTNGYGSTEVGESITVDGLVTPGTEVALDDDGVVWVRREAMSDGYYDDGEKESEQNAKRVSLLRAGFMCTGDIGELSTGPEGSQRLSLLGRVNAVPKLANGKFCRLELIESHVASELADSTQPFVFLSASRIFLMLAVYSPQAPQVQVKAKVREVLMQLLRQGKLAPHEIPIGLLVFNEIPLSFVPPDTVVCSTLFTLDNHCLTRTMKVRRMEVEKRFRLWDKAASLERTLDDAITAAFSTCFGEHSSSLERARAAVSVANNMCAPVSTIFSCCAAVVDHQQGHEDKKACDPRRDIFSWLEPLTRLSGGRCEGSNPHIFVPDPRPTAVVNVTDTCETLSHYRCVLITGATGHVGSCVLRRLLLSEVHERKRFVCPLRRDGLTTAFDRLVQACIKSNDDEATTRLLISRMKTCCIPFFPPENAREFSAESLVVSCKVELEKYQDEMESGPMLTVHLASDVDFVKPLHELQSANAELIVAILSAFCASDVLVVSTSSVDTPYSHLMVQLGGIREGVDLDVFAQRSQDCLLRVSSGSGYIASKLLGELGTIMQVGTSSNKEKRRVSILRLPFVWCDHNDGASNPDDILCRTLRGCHEMGLCFPLPIAEGNDEIGLQVVYRDDCAATILARCEALQREGESSTVTIRDLVPNVWLSAQRLLKELWTASGVDGERSIASTYAHWLDVVFDPVKGSNALLPLAPLFLDAQQCQQFPPCFSCADRGPTEAADAESQKDSVRRFAEGIVALRCGGHAKRSNGQ